MNSINLGFDPYEFLDSIPLERTVQIHLAGGRYVNDMLVDTHSTPVNETVWEMLGYVLDRAPVKAVLLEWDQDWPEFGVLLDHLDRARAVLRASRVSGVGCRPVTLLDMQRVFSRILTDKAFQQAFSQGAVPDPETYQLTERELSSLRGLRWDRVTLHADLLAHTRLELALKGLPLTGLVLQEQLHAHLDGFCAEHPPVPQAASQLYLEASRLCDFAARLLDEGTLRPAWAIDLIGYERVMLTMAVSTEVAASAAEVARLNEEPITGDIGDHIPVGGPHITVLSFGSPLPDLLPVLDEGTIPVSVPPLEHPLLVLFHRVSRGPVRLVKVNAAAAALIEACDGERTVTEVMRLLSHRFGPGIEAKASGALGWLRETGAIGLRGEN